MTMVATGEVLDGRTPCRSPGGFVRLAARGCGGALVLVGLAESGQAIAAHGLPLPGPVIGLTILAFALIAAGAVSRSLGRSAAAFLTPAARLSLRHMGLLFVPAGVGIMTQGDLLRVFWLPALAGLFGSTLIAVAVTGLVLHRCGGSAEERS